VTFAYIEREVTSILSDREKSKTSKVAAGISHDSEDPVASSGHILHSEENHVAASLQRVNLARRSQSQPMANTESPNQHGRQCLKKNVKML
jgi:hypothetical protein